MVVKKVHYSMYLIEHWHQWGAPIKTMAWKSVDWCKSNSAWQAAVAELITRGAERSHIRSLLECIYDFERIVGRRNWLCVS